MNGIDISNIPKRRKEMSLKKHTIEEYEETKISLLALKKTYPLLEKQLDISISCVEYVNEMQNYCCCEENIEHKPLTEEQKEQLENARKGLEAIFKLVRNGEQK